MSPPEKDLENIYLTIKTMGNLLRGQYDMSSQVPMPSDRVDDTSVSNNVAAETLTWLYVTAGAFASATGQAAGTVVMGKLTYSGITNSAKIGVGHTLDTSFVPAATTRIDTRVDVPDEVFYEMAFMSPTGQAAKIAEYLKANGHYCVNHRTSQIWAKSKAIVADDTVAYSYLTTLSGGGAGDKVDLIKVGGTAVDTNSFLRVCASVS